MNNPASQLASMRKQVTHTCPTCGNQFTAIKKAIYCSTKCLRRAKYLRTIGSKPTE